MQFQCPSAFPKAFTQGHYFTEGGKAGIRADSGMGLVQKWDVPEAEFGFISNQNAEPTAFFLCYDMSSRSIEGGSPLLLPHAKIYKNCCGISRWITIPECPFDFWKTLELELTVTRGDEVVFGGNQTTKLLRRSLQELANHVYRMGPWNEAVYVTTGTNIVPKSGDTFTLEKGDKLLTKSAQLGTFSATVDEVDWPVERHFKPNSLKNS